MNLGAQPNPISYEYYNEYIKTMRKITKSENFNYVHHPVIFTSTVYHSTDAASILTIKDFGLPNLNRNVYATVQELFLVFFKHIYITTPTPPNYTCNKHLTIFLTRKPN